MFQGFKEDLLSFYADIRFHNEKAFMDAHRQEYYEKVRGPFYDFINELAPVMQQIDEDIEVRPNKCLSRINRDTRFTKDKSPYRDHHWVAFRQAATDKAGLPFFWFEIRLDSVNWGVGVWGENQKLFDALRRRMEAKPDEVREALMAAAGNGFSANGQVWKKMRPPDTIPDDLKSVYCAKELYFDKRGVQPEWIFEPSIVQRVAEDFKRLAPLYRLLRGLNELGEEQNE